MTRVMIVGTGALTALGPTTRDLWVGARAGRVAIGPIDGFSHCGAQVRDLDKGPEPALDLAIAAASEAMAALPDGLIRPERIGLVLGTCNAGLQTARRWLQSDDPDPASARLITPQGLAEAVAAKFGLGGPVLAVSTACASGANAIGLAADLVRSGRADAVLTGGTDALSDMVFAGFSALEALSPHAATPYSATRDGLSLGEGSAVLLLVDARLTDGLPVLAEVAGYGLAADGHHPTAPRPDGSGAAEAMRAAMRDAGVKPADIGYVNGHGTGTEKNDIAETKAIRLALGDAADRVLVSSTKSVIGHLLGAAGAAEAVVTAHAVATGIAPPTAGYTHPDPACDLDYVPRKAKTFTASAVISNNFGFGGANASIVLTHPDRPGPPEPEVDRVVITGSVVLGPDVDPDPVLSRRDRRRMDRLAVVSVVAAAQALAEADVRSDQMGVLFGTGTGPVEAAREFMLPLLTSNAASPAAFPNTVYNQTAGHIATKFGLYGPTSTLSVGQATCAAVLAYATDLLATGRANALLAVVTDTVNEDVKRAYSGYRGFSPSESCVAVVLERRRSALDRGAPILAEIRGIGAAFDGRRWDPRGGGMERAMRAALAKVSDVDNLWLAARGIGPFDRAEQRAIRRVFETAPASHRSTTPARALDGPPGIALVNSSSFGGSHVSLLMEVYGC